MTIIPHTFRQLTSNHECLNVVDRVDVEHAVLHYLPHLLQPCRDKQAPHKALSEFQLTLTSISNIIYIYISITARGKDTVYICSPHPTRSRLRIYEEKLANAINDKENHLSEVTKGRGLSITFDWTHGSNCIALY